MKIGRNDPCPCGSGKKYKKCCLNEQQASPMDKLKALKPVTSASKVSGISSILKPQQQKAEQKKDKAPKRSTKATTKLPKRKQSK